MFAKNPFVMPKYLVDLPVPVYSIYSLFDLEFLSLFNCSCLIIIFTNANVNIVHDLKNTPYSSTHKF